MFSHSRRDVNVRVMNLSKIVVEARKGDPLRMVKEIKDQISWLQEQADKARAKKLLEIGQNSPTICKDTNSQ
jgi:hypothetical protein